MRGWKVQRPHVVAVERIDHCDLVRIDQLGRATVELLFLLIRVGAAHPVPNLETGVICRG